MALTLYAGVKLTLLLCVCIVYIEPPLISVFFKCLSPAVSSLQGTLTGTVAWGENQG